MKLKIVITIFILFCILNKTYPQYSYGDHWYDNPLGFEPLNLHTSMGAIIPALAVGTVLIFTKSNPNLKNKISIYNETGLSWGYKYPKTFLPQNNTGINYMLRDYMSVGIEMSIVSASDDFNSTTGIAIRPFARFYPFNTKDWRMYFESGGGLIYTFTEFPKPNDIDGRLGLELNGITKYGLGAEVNISSKTSLMFGVRHLHISNGNTKGVERNPSHDSNGFFLGIDHKF